MLQLSVIAPCYNEENNIRQLAERLLMLFEKHSISGEVVLINDASTDRTQEIGDMLVAQYSNVHCIRHDRNQGIAGGWMTGVEAAKGQLVCFIDADLQNPPEEVWRLYREMQWSLADMIQGTRSSIGRMRDSRYFLSRTLNVILNLLFGMKAVDNKSGFVIAHREVLQDILASHARYHYYQTFIRVAAEAKGYSVKEVETLFQERKVGKSFIKKFPLMLIAKVIGDCMRAFFEFRMGSQRHDVLQQFLASHTPVRKPSIYRGWRKLWYELYFLTMPLHAWVITRRAKFYHQLLCSSQYLSSKDMRELQEVKLRRLIRDAYRHVPYYRQMMENLGLGPKDIASLDDLRKLPMLSKKQLRENLYFDLFSATHNKKEMIRICTSGSTGEPLVTYAERRQLEMRWASTLRAYEWTGWKFGDRQVRLWHQTIGMSFLQVVREKTDAWFMNRLFIPAYEIREDNIEDFLRKIRRHRPVLMDGYAESFNFLAHYSQQAQKSGIRPKAIMSSAQVMPDHVRAKIQNTFSTEVFDKYGSREFSGIAYECEAHDGHHVIAESYIVEVLVDNRPAKPGEIGEIVITDLNNFSVPLIRYRIGDLATVMEDRPCACGRGMPKLGRIEGRAQAIILGANGAWVPGTFFSHYFKEYEFALRQYQIVQTSRDSLTVKIIKNESFSADVEQEILSGLRKFLGETMDITMEFVESIPMVKTGKRTSVVSMVDYDFQDVSGTP
ncbi:glycosyltransferase [Candidatus Peribacteria bacterium]|nr:glycosyltransferase [Candidatus Peribacteria bacterium]